MKRLLCSAVASVLLGATSSVFAYDGFATGNVNLRAGPDTDYPVVLTIPVGEPLSIQGCTDGWEWCDVVYADARGWVAGNYIQYEYQDRPVLLSGYGAAIGIPIVSFVIADYWGRWYHDRPFWGQRDRWFARPYVRREPPRPFGGPMHDYGHGYAHGGLDHGYAQHGSSGHPEYHGAPNTHGQVSQSYHGNAQSYHGNNQNQVNQGNHGPANTPHASTPQVQAAHAQTTHTDSHSSSHNNSKDDHDHGH